MGLNFGTGGWRALIGDDFIKSNIRQFGLKLVHIAKEKTDAVKPIVVGYDNRFLSKEASNWLVEELNELGVNTLTFGESVPTPLVMHYVKSQELDYGVMITASHNPYQWNGIKLFVKGGLDAPKELTDRFADDNSEWWVPQSIYGNNSIVEDAFEIYKKDLFTLLNLDKINEFSKNLFIAFDGMHGSGSELFCNLLKELGIKYSSYNTEIDPYFHNGVTCCPEPTAENCREFIRQFNAYNSQAYVAQQMKGDTSQLDVSGIPFNLGIIFDGDGDRLMVLDENGNVISMNQLLCIFYWYLRVYCNEQGAIIRNSVTTSILDRMATVFGDELVEVPVGFKWITQAMLTHNGLMGGESSGGFAIRGHIYGKDSILSSLFLINILCVTQKTLGEILNNIEKKFGVSVFMEHKIPITSDAMKEKLINYIDTLEIPNATMSNLDGKKFIVGNGRWLSFRLSGTEPILRVMVEAPTKYDAEQTIKTVLSAIPVQDVKK